jgi:hypothetical protein
MNGSPRNAITVGVPLCNRKTITMAKIDCPIGRFVEENCNKTQDA